MQAISYIYPEIILGFCFILFFVYTLVTKVEFRTFSIVVLPKIFALKDNKRLVDDNRGLKNIVISFFYEVKNIISYEKNLEEKLITRSEKIFLIYSFLLCLLGFFLYSVLLVLKINYESNLQEAALFFNASLVIDLFSLFFKALIMLLGFFYFLITYFTTKFWKFYGMEFGFLIFIIIFSMLLLVSAVDFFFIFLAIELQSLSIVVLTAFQVTQKRSIEAGLKYFILSSFFSGIYLFGVSLIYLLIGSVSFVPVYELTFGGTLGSELKDNLFIISILLVVSTLLFKLGLVPYYFWTPDVYQGANLLVTSFLAVVSKIGLLVVSIRIFYTVFVNYFYAFEDLLYYIALLSIFVGALLALFQTDLKRFLAYSSMSNIGYVFLALSIGSYDSLMFGILYFILYVFGTFGFILVILGFVKKDNVELKTNVTFFANDLHDFRFLVSINDLEGLYKNNKVLTFVFIIILFNLIGVPPFFFFFGKFFLFDICLSNNLYLAIVILIVTSFISAFYYLRIIKVMFLNRSSESKIFAFSSIEIATLLFFLMLMMIVLLFSPVLLIYFIELIQKIIMYFFSF